MNKSSFISKEIVANKLSDTEKINKIADDILSYSRNALIVDMRFLSSALCKLKPKKSDMLSFATDGEFLYYNPMYIISRYKQSKELPTRDFLHAVMHCLFCHMYADNAVDWAIWNLACDISVENVISELRQQSTTTGSESLRQQTYAELGNKVSRLTAEKIYAYYINNRPTDERLKELRDIFKSDDHLLWFLKTGNYSGAMQEEGETCENETNNQATGASTERSAYEKSEADRVKQEWKNISERVEKDLQSFSKSKSDGADFLMQNLTELHREKYDYAEFLKQFSSYGEAMKVDDDSFDYVFYTYGLKLYDKMPLIEPPEYKEVKRIKEFIIAIDTSRSVSGKTVQTFLQKTYNILKQKENFFTKFVMHIIQCDTDIREDVKITSEEEFDEYIGKMQLKGFGGTDFRPVFDYVDRLIARKEFVNLKGLIYFTDGRGIFPARPPKYKTAFVFVDDALDEISIPIWAMRVVLPQENIR